MSKVNILSKFLIIKDFIILDDINYNINHYMLYYMFLLLEDKNRW